MMLQKGNCGDGPFAVQFAIAIDKLDPGDLGSQFQQATKARVAGTRGGKPGREVEVHHLGAKIARPYLGSVGRTGIHINHPRRSGKRPQAALQALSLVAPDCHDTELSILILIHETLIWLAGKDLVWGDAV